MTYDEIKARYETRIFKILERIRDVLIEADQTCEWPPADATDMEYAWCLFVNMSGIEHPRYEPITGIDITFSIVESNGEEEWDDVNFSIRISDTSGIILGCLPPFNYTPEMRVPIDDEDAVEERFQIVEHADPYDLLDCISASEYYRKATPPKPEMPKKKKPASSADRKRRTKLTIKDGRYKHIEQIVTTGSAIIDYANIRAASGIETDDDYGPPWEDCDGFEHECVEVREHDHYDEIKQAIGCFYAPDCGYRGYQLVTLTNPESYGTQKYMHARGASKQVAYEAQKHNERATIRQIVEWRMNGWPRWYAYCKFEIADKEYHEACGGIDDEEYAEEVRDDMIDSVIGQLEKDGFTVTNRPPEPDPRVRKFQNFRAMLKRNQDTQNWPGPVVRYCRAARSYEKRKARQEKQDE